MLVLITVGCSTKKNTPMTRQWHAFTGRYNTYFNGTQSYIDGSLEKEKGNKDNYTEQIPLYTVGNKKSRDIGKGKYEAAITKAQKTIQLHSIKTKPEWTKNRRKTEKDIEWLSRKEYNPFLWRAWMLMGRSQFYKGSFDEAAATFSYMSRLYKGQPAIYGKARAWLAKCYIESDWLYDAEDVIRKMERDSIDWRAQKEWDYTYCDYYLHNGNVPQAITYLKKVIKHEMRATQRAREYFLLGQLYASQGQRQEAYEAFRKVSRQNPPYELDFNARIAMTEVMAQGQAKKMISRLKRMAHNDNNKDYLDQVYYAIGNIYLAEKDTMQAIYAYEKGNEKATRSGVEKGVLLLHLGDLYWIKERYGDAKRCYGEAIGLLDKERPDYEQLSKRSKILDELVPFTDGIQLQDSLQQLAKMSEKDRNAAIDRVIDALKKKEKEEAAKAAEQEAEQRQQKYANNNGNQRNSQQRNAPVQNNNNNGSTTWYFYNTQAVTQGKQTFQRMWGKRENTDDWQRNNKTVVGGLDNNEQLAEENMTQEQRDSVAMADSIQSAQEAKMDSAVNDPHKREYYLAQIPFTEEQLVESNNIIKDGLYHSGVIFKDKLDNLALSDKAFTRLQTQYPEYDPKDEMYYHLFLLHSRKGDGARAQTYVDSLKAYYPDSKWTTLLTDPYFADNARFGKHVEDSLYGATYTAFKEDRYQEVYTNNELSAKRFPLGDNRGRFIFLDGMTRLNNGDPDSCVRAMELVVREYPKCGLSELAGMIVNGVKAGKRLRGAKFDLTDVWNRRSMVLNDKDSTQVKELSKETNTDYFFIIAYPPDSLDENKLLFQVARFNFSSFMGRAFDLTIEDAQGMHHMMVSGFRNYDEARQYSKILLNQEGIKAVMGKARPIVISNENLQMLGVNYSYNEYDEFFNQNFAPLMILKPEMLYEPVIATEPEPKKRNERTEPDEREEERRAMKEDDDMVKPILPTEEVAPGGAMPETPKTPEELEAEDNMIAVPSETEVTLPVETEVAIPAETEVAIPAETEVTLPAETEVAVPVETEATLPAETEVAVPTETEVTIADDTEVTVSGDNEIVIGNDSDASSASDDVEIVIDDSTGQSDNKEDEIILDDAKPSTDAIEDEYYELDGF